MNICGILVHMRPEQFEVVSERLSARTGIEVHGISEDGRAVVTLETVDNDASAEALTGIQQVEGVINASMIYHYCDDAEHKEVLDENDVVPEEVAQ